MSFTLLSIALVGCVGLAVFKEVLTGIKRGLSRSLIALSVVILSAVAAAPLAIWLSDFPVRWLEAWVNDSIPAIENYSQNLPSLPRIALGALDALITPILFVILFVVIRIVLKAIVELALKRLCKPLSDNPSRVGSYISFAASDGPSYVRSDAPWHVRNDRLLGALTSALCGFLSAIILLSPVLGTFSTVSRLQRLAEEKNFNMKNVGLNGGAVDTLAPYFSDASIAVFNFTGGSLIYDGVATTVLIDGNNVSLKKEMNACIDITTDMLNVLRAISSKQPLSAEQKALTSGLGARIDSSDTMKLIATDVVTGACKSWLAGDAFMKMGRPAIGDSLSVVLDGILQVCAGSTHECVGRDITTMLNVYQIILDYNIANGMSNADFLTLLNDNAFMDRLYGELNKNPCMQPLTVQLVDTSLSVMSKAFNTANLTEEQRTQFMSLLAESVNRVNGMGGSSFDQKVEAMASDTVHYAKQYGIEIPEGVADMAATSMLQQLGEQKNMTAGQMQSFLNQSQTVRTTQANGE